MGRRLVVYEVRSIRNIGLPATIPRARATVGSADTASRRYSAPTRGVLYFCSSNEKIGSVSRSFSRILSPIRPAGGEDVSGARLGMETNPGSHSRIADHRLFFVAVFSLRPRQRNPT